MRSPFSPLHTFSISPVRPFAFFRCGFPIILIFFLITSVHCTAQYFRWAHQVSGTQYQEGAAVSYSPNGNVYFTGEYIGTANYLIDTFPQPPSNDAFYIISLKDDGSKNWTKSWYGFNDVNSRAIDVDGNENILVAGAFDYSIYFEDDTLIINSPAFGHWETFLIKLDSSGNHLWSAKGSANTAGDSVYPTAMACNNSHAWISGFFTGDTAIFDTLTFSNLNDSIKSFIASFSNATGALEWAKIGTGGTHKYSHITADSSGNLYLIGEYYGWMTLDSDTVTARGGKEIYIAKFDLSGNLLYLRTAGGKSDDFAGDISVSGDGFLYLTGSVKDTAWFDSQLVIANSSPDIFVAKYDLDGNPLWVKLFTVSQNATNSSAKPFITVNPSNEIFLAASFKDTVVLDTTIFISSGNFDAFLAKINPSGNILWAKQFGGSSPDLLKDIDAGASSDVYLAGTFITSINFDTLSLTGTGQEDAFIAKSGCYLIQPVITSPNQSFCENDSALLHFTPASWLSYLWNTGQTDTSVFVSATDSLSLIAYDKYGCAIASDTFYTYVSQLIKPLLFYSDTFFCEGGQELITVASQPGVTYQWPDSSFGAGFFADTTMDVHVTATDTIGCKKYSDTVRFREIIVQEPSFSVTDSVICPGDTETISIIALPSITYQWGDSSTAAAMAVNSGGTYSATAYDTLYGCSSAVNSIYIYEPWFPKPDINFAGVNPFCEGDSVSIYLTASYSDFVYVWPTGDTALQIYEDTTRTVFVAASDTNGCFLNSDTIQTTALFVNKPLIYSPDTIICQGESTWVYVTPDSTHAWYWWSTNVWDTAVQISSSQQVYAVAYDSSWCEKYSDTIQIVKIIVDVPEISPWPKSELCGAGDTVYIWVWPTYPELTYTWSTGWVGDMLPLDTPSIVFATAADTNGCTSSSMPLNVVAGPVSPPQVYADSGLYFCYGDSIPLFINKISNFQVDWSSGSSDTLVYINNTDSVFVWWTSEGGCTAYSDTYLVSEVSPLALPVSSSTGNWLCPGESALVATTAYPQVTNYSWSNGAAGSSQLISQPDTFYLTATDSFGCTSFSDTLIVQMVSLLPMSLLSDKPPLLCENELLLLFPDTVSPIYSYLWSDGTAGPKLNAAGAGAFSFLATDTNGCTFYSDTVIVQQAIIPEPLILSASPPAFCDGDSVMLYFIPDSGISYQWNTGVTAQSIITDTSGNFWVIATDTLYSFTSDTLVCISYSDTVTLKEFKVPLPLINASGLSLFCEGGSVQLFVDSPVAGLSYLWNNGIYGTIILADTSSNYLVTALDTIPLLNGDTLVCSSVSDSYPVLEVVLAEPVIGAAGPLSFCEGGGVQLFVYSPVNGFSYLWNNGVNDTALYSDSALACSVIAIDTLISIIGDTVVCGKSSDTLQTAILAMAKPVINFTGQSAFCEGGGVQLSLNAVTQTSYQWSDGTAGLSLYADTTGGYSVIATDSFFLPSGDTVFCSENSDTVSIYEMILPEPVIQFTTPLTFCEGDSAILFVNPASLISYIWQNGNNDTMLVTDTGGNYWIIAMDTLFLPGNDTLVCTKSSGTVTTVEVIIPKPAIFSTGPTLFCKGGGVQLFTNKLNGIASLWSTGQIDTLIYVDSSGSYFVTAYDTNGCTKSSDTVVVNAISLPDVSINDSGGAMLCMRDTLWLYTVYYPGLSILWSTGVTDTIIEVTAAGSYSLSLQDTNGCIAYSDTILVTGSSVSPIILQQRCDSIFINNSFIGYKWFLNDSLLISDSLPYLIVKKNGQYYLIVTDSNGCVLSSDTLNVYTAKKTAVINIYPNPVSSRMVIESENLPDDYLEIEVVSAFGTQVSQEKAKPQRLETEPATSGCNGAKNIFSVPLDVENMEPGVYFIIIRSQYVQNSFKVVKL